ncbi:MAG: T9SS type A sorting domain-containing protein, partial [Proteobacteria bacterium]|nr:T9SS type A sorting domain-containing protein [Pseudomonadota bacterium]
QFNSKNKKGKRNQKVTITANTTPMQTYLYLTGNVLFGENTDLTVDGETEDSRPTEISPDCFTIYPNPTAEFFVIDITESHYGSSAKITIMSESGQRMAQREVESISDKIKFDVAHYPPGIYSAVVQIGKNTTQSQCFVVME